MTQEFKNLMDLLESPNKENVALALQIAQNYQKEFQDYFGCSLEKLKSAIKLKNTVFQVDYFSTDTIYFSETSLSEYLEMSLYTFLTQYLDCANIVVHLVRYALDEDIQINKLLEILERNKVFYMSNFRTELIADLWYFIKHLKI